MAASRQPIKDHVPAEPDPEELAVGSRAADFHLPSSSGSEISLSDYLGKSHVVLFFVREFI
jgi:peroxiredoxin